MTTHPTDNAPVHEMLAGTTPGPWLLDRDWPDSPFPCVLADDDTLICEVSSMGTDRDEWVSNARLIAAAPDLAAEVARLRAINTRLVEALKSVAASAMRNAAYDACVAALDASAMRNAAYDACVAALDAADQRGPVLDARGVE